MQNCVRSGHLSHWFAVMVTFADDYLDGHVVHCCSLHRQVAEFISDVHIDVWTNCTFPLGINVLIISISIKPL